MPYTFVKIIFLSIIASSFASCSLLERTATQELSEGVYRFKSGESKARKVYVQLVQDSLLIYPMLPGRPRIADTTRSFSLEVRESSRKARKDYLLFRQPSFDIDILSILFKYRPREAGLGRQLETGFNGALYLGYRTDSYTLSYERTPLQNYKRNIDHFGYSFGLFTGLGASLIAPWFTYDQVQAEYDGLIFINGVAANVAYNNITFGLGVGFDHLLDQNSKYWVYQGEPWFGLTLGLNLN